MMKKLSLCTLAVLAALPATMSAMAAETDSGMQLQQVLMLSRHNLRAPLAQGGSLLEQSSDKKWPQWDVPGGELTTRGGVLEVYMGKYTHDWLVQQGVIKANQCPDPNSVFVYANSLQRTVATAQYFVTGAFPGCDVSVTHQDAMGTMDPVFNPIISNDSPEFAKAAVEAMQQQAKQTPLQSAYNQLSAVSGYAASAECKGKEKCTLATTPNKFSIVKGKEPSVEGALKTGNALVDAFTLQYYQGFPADQVAWGKVTTPEQWQALSSIKNAYQNILFTTPAVAHDVAAPLVDYIRSQLIDQDNNSAPAVTFMVGHDSNIASLLASLKVKPYQLPDQYEQTPIGGQLVFERWHDKKNNKDLLKIEYVYQSTEQLRNAEDLSLSHPPKRVTLELSGCPTDSNGYCSWQDFTHVMDDALQGTAMQPHMATDTSDTPAAADSQTPATENNAVPAATAAPQPSTPAASAPATAPGSQQSPQTGNSSPATTSVSSHDASQGQGGSQGQSAGAGGQGNKP